MQPKTFISTSTLESYLYHVIVTSTVHEDVVTPGLTPATIARYFEALSGELCCPVTNLKLLGVSVSVLLELFYLSWLRREILSGLPDAMLWHAACPIGTRLHSKKSATPIESSFLDILYTSAYWLFRSLLLDGAITSKELSSSRNGGIYSQIEIEEAIRFVCSIPEPSHVVTWPLLVIGLASEGGDLREQIEECFKRLIENSRLNSTASSLGILKVAWNTHIGLSVLLSPSLDEMLVF